MIPPSQDIDVTIDRLAREIGRLEQQTNNQQTHRRELEVALLKRRLANLRQVRDAQTQTRNEVLRECRDVLSDAFHGGITPMIASGFSELFSKVKDLIHLEDEDGDGGRAASNHGCPIDDYDNDNGSEKTDSDCIDDNDVATEFVWERVRSPPKEMEIVWRRIHDYPNANSLRTKPHECSSSRRMSASDFSATDAPADRRKRMVAKNLIAKKIIAARCPSAIHGIVTPRRNRVKLLGENVQRTEVHRARAPADHDNESTHRHSSMKAVMQELQDRVALMEKLHAKNDAVIDELVKRLLVREVCQKNRARREKKGRVHAVLAELMKRFLVREIHERSQAQEETRNKIFGVIDEFRRRLVLQEVTKNAAVRCSVHRHKRKVSRELMERFHAHEDLRTRSDQLLREMVMRWVVLELKETSHTRAVYVEKNNMLIQELKKLFVVRQLRQRTRDKETHRAKIRLVLDELKERTDAVETVAFKQLVIHDITNYNASRCEHRTNMKRVLSELLFMFVVDEMKGCRVTMERTDGAIEDLKDALDWVSVDSSRDSSSSDEIDEDADAVVVMSSRSPPPSTAGLRVYPGTEWAGVSAVNDWVVC